MDGDSVKSSGKKHHVGATSGPWKEWEATGGSKKSCKKHDAFFVFFEVKRLKRESRHGGFLEVQGSEKCKVCEYPARMIAIIMDKTAFQVSDRLPAFNCKG